MQWGSYELVRHRRWSVHDLSAGEGSNWMPGERARPAPGVPNTPGGFAYGTGVMGQEVPLDADIAEWQPGHFMDRGLWEQHGRLMSTQ